MKTIMLTLCLLLGASTASADTRTGVAKKTDLQMFSWFNLGSGHAEATVSWKKASSDVVLIIVCDSSDPQTYGIARAGMDRLAQLVVGPPRNDICVLGVGGLQGPNTPYRLHVNQSAEEVTSSEGRQGFAVAAPTHMLELHVQHEFRRLLGK